MDCSERREDELDPIPLAPEIPSLQQPANSTRSSAAVPRIDKVSTPAQHCRHCGYSLQGLPGLRCPECGGVAFESTANVLNSIESNQERVIWIGFRSVAILACMIVILVVIQSQSRWRLQWDDLLGVVSLTWVAMIVLSLLLLLAARTSFADFDSDWPRHALGVASMEGVTLAFGVATSMGLGNLHFTPLWPWCLVFGLIWVTIAMKRLLDISMSEAVILAVLHRIMELGVFVSVSKALG